MNDSPAPAPPARHVVLLWGTALGLLATALTAPVRPWGWQGGTSLGLALMLSVIAHRATAGLPPRRLLLPVLATATLLPLLFRVVLPALRGSDAG